MNVTVHPLPAWRRRAGTPVRVAVVGLGWAAGSIWLPRLRAHRGYVVTAGVDPSATARAAARSLADVPLLADLAELDAGDLDLAVVSVPNHLHVAVACRLLRKGIPVFVEKPVCLSTAEAQELATAERAGGALALAGSAARYRGDVQALMAASADLGPVRHVDLAWVRARGVPRGDGWFTHRRLAGGGALVDLGWHLLDAVTPLLGQASFEQVVGTVSADHLASGRSQATWRGDHADPRPPGNRQGAGGGSGNGASPGDVEDTARGFLVTSEGVSVSLHASWASHQGTDVTSIRVDGTEGTVALRCTFGFSPNRVPTSTLTLTRQGQVRQLPVERERIGAEYDRQLDDLLRMLDDPTSRGRAVAEARRTVGVVERLYDSARRPRPAPGRGLQAVIFDLDGVLVNSLPVMRQAFGIAYAEVVGDGPPPFEEYTQHLGRYFPDIMRIMGLPLAMQEPFVRESQRLADRVTVFPGVVDLLHELRQRGLGLAVATGKSGPRARWLLDRLGIAGLFHHVIGSDEVARAKPAPDIVRRALELLEVSPQGAVMVGDAVTDLASAHGAGVAAAAALWGDTDRDALLAAGPEIVLQAPADLLEVVSLVPV